MLTTTGMLLSLLSTPFWEFRKVLEFLNEHVAKPAPFYSLLGVSLASNL